MYLHSHKHFKSQTGLTVISEAKPRAQKPFVCCEDALLTPAGIVIWYHASLVLSLSLSMVTNEVLDYIYTVHSHRIINWDPAVLNPTALQTYAQVIS